MKTVTARNQANADADVDAKEIIEVLDALSGFAQDRITELRFKRDTLISNREREAHVHGKPFFPEAIGRHFEMKTAPIVAMIRKANELADRLEGRDRPDLASDGREPEVVT